MSYSCGFQSQRKAADDRGAFMQTDRLIGPCFMLGERTKNSAAADDAKLLPPCFT